MTKENAFNNLIHKKTNWIVFFLLVLLVIQAISSMQKKTVTTDEQMILTMGYTYLRTGQLFVFGHTTSIHNIASLPLLFLDLEMPPSLEYYIHNNYYSSYSDKFFYVYNNDKVEQIVFLGRIPIVIISILLGIFVFRWSREIYGIKAGLFALFLYSFSPNILANSRLATTDIGYSCFMFIALYYFWKFVNNKTSKNLLLAGITFGLAQVSKFTALSLIPIYLILIFLLFYYKKPINTLKELFSKKMLKKIGIMFYSFVVILIIGLVIINLNYCFQGSFKSLGKNLRDDKSEYFDHNIYNTDSIVNRLVPSENKAIKKISYFVIDNLPIIVPYPYLKNLVGITKLVSSVPNYGYFMGNRGVTGKNTLDLWYGYIFATLIKTPIPTLILLFLSLIFFGRIKSKDILNEYFLVIPIIFIIIYFSFFFQLKAVLRYILPMYPFMFVFISKIINLKIRKQILVYCGIGILSVWYLFSSISIYPHYLAYFNEFVGPDNGYKYLGGSNLDWGQDLKGLGEYIKKGGISKINLAYTGTASPDYYNIPYNYLKYYMNHSIEDCTPKKGVIAISATYLQGLNLNDVNCFNWLKKYEPIEKIGYSIFIYNITE